MKIFMLPPFEENSYGALQSATHVPLACSTSTLQYDDPSFNVEYRS